MILITATVTAEKDRANIVRDFLIENAENICNIVGAKLSFIPHEEVTLTTIVVPSRDLRMCHNCPEISFVIDETNEPARAKSERPALSWRSDQIRDDILSLMYARNINFRIIRTAVQGDDREYRPGS